MDCLFCEIAAGKKENLIWQNYHAAAFKDIHPKAKTHILVVPKKHIRNIDELDDMVVAGRSLQAIKEVAEQEGITGNYKVQVNNGKAAGQEIDHLHFHVMSDKA